MPWWAWLALGAALLGAEVLVQTEFWLAVIGAAALALGLLLTLRIEAPLWLQWAAFAVLAVAFDVLFRRRHLRDSWPAAAAAWRPRLDGRRVRRRAASAIVPGGARHGGAARHAPGARATWARRALGRGAACAVEGRTGSLLRRPRLTKEGGPMETLIARRRGGLALLVIVRDRAHRGRSCRSRAPTWSRSSGKYSRTLHAGFHILVPFIERDRLQAQPEGAGASTSPSRSASRATTCRCGVDGVLYLQVLDPSAPPTGSRNYLFAISQLAQTTLRSEIGKIELDRTFEERARDQRAGRDRSSTRRPQPWGVKVLRYEIKNITPPADVIYGDGEADARRAREARGGAHLRGPSATPRSTHAEGEKQR